MVLQFVSMLLLQALYLHNLDNWHNSLANGFFYQSPFEVNKMFCLLNKSVLLANQKQPLTCVQQTSYLDLRSYTL